MNSLYVGSGARSKKKIQTYGAESMNSDTRKQTNFVMRSWDGVKAIYSMIDVDIKVCVQCGIIYHLDWYYNDLYCKKCNQKMAARRGKAKAAEMRANGYIPESRKRAGRKAYYSRMANLDYSDRNRFERLFKNLRSRAPGKAAQVTRRINAKIQL